MESGHARRGHAGNSRRVAGWKDEQCLIQLHNCGVSGDVL